MDPTQLAPQPTIFMESFLTVYGPAIQAAGFFGWFLFGVLALALIVAIFMLVGPARRAMKEYVRFVESQIGPAPVKDIDEGAVKVEDAAVDVDKFVE